MSDSEIITDEDVEKAVEAAYDLEFGHGAFQVEKAWRLRELDRIPWYSGTFAIRFEYVRAALSAVIPGLIAKAAEGEREACALIADDEDGHFTWSGEDRNVRVGQRVASEIAAAIRARKD